jgi:hypothetical protein
MNALDFWFETVYHRSNKAKKKPAPLGVLVLTQKLKLQMPYAFLSVRRQRVQTLILRTLPSSMIVVFWTFTLN